LGDIYHGLDMVAASDVAYRESIRLDSTNVSAMNNLAYYLSLRKVDLDYAAEISKKSNEINPDNATFQDTYAWVLFQQERYKEALVWIEKAVKLTKPASAVVLEHYGDILVKNGKTAEAIKQWKLALRMADGDYGKLQEKINTGQYVD